MAADLRQQFPIPLLLPMGKIDENASLCPSLNAFLVLYAKVEKTFHFAALAYYFVV